MITNGSDLSIDDVGMTPNVEDALSGWLRKVIVGLITKSIVDFQVKEDRLIYEIMAVRQPMATKQLILKPEGQRAWGWEKLHVKSGEVEFNLDDQILLKNVKYRVMQKFDYKDRGFIEYDIVEDWGQSFDAVIQEGLKISEVQSGT